MATETNVTVVVGRDAIFTCKVENLQNYKVAWLRVDTQTILTIGPLVITKNHRVAVVRGDPQTWSLALRDVRPTDAGQYMCQINTEPMITQTHYLQVFVPPDIVDTGSSGEVIVHEGDNVTLHCAASGTPQPTITWRREDSSPMRIRGQLVNKWSGEWFIVAAVNRDMNGAFLCIATNGVPPSVSKRILLHVLCKPTTMAAQKMIGGYLAESVVLECNIEANPAPVVIWTHVYGNRIYNGSKYQASIKSSGYKHSATLRINNVSRDDIGSYKCHVENSLGVARDDVTLYTLAATTVTTTTLMTHGLEETSTSYHSYSTEKYDDDDNFVVVLSRHQMQNTDIVTSS
ncbi:lachesin-like [Epargyreus clarus]|uniref:lachesin-like n=1 Tax=Epargyreus clarus TaxID=520877 RepID=UPI003C2C4886